MKVLAVVAVLVLGVVAVGGFFLYKNKAQVKMMLASPTPTTTMNTTDTTSPTPAAENAIALTVKVPADGAKVTTTKVTVSGTTSPNADVSVNEANTTADAKGNFSLTVNLDEGDNYLLVLAVDADGKTAQKQIMVTSQTYE